MAFIFFRQFWQRGFSMKCCIVENNSRFCFYCLQKTMLKPTLKKVAIRCACVLHRCYPLLLTNTRNKIGSFEFFATDFGQYCFTTHRSGVLAVKVLFNSAFINIHQTVSLESFQPSQELLLKTLVRFPIFSRFFYALSSIVAMRIEWLLDYS